ncbi:MAG TPA: hypothetical protein VK968_08440, partial [Roseimicrobium sp.]|nr:hypothetical protein [Roseimicrobium sp.]
RDVRVGRTVIATIVDSARSTGGAAPTREMVGRTDAGWQLTLVRDEDGKAVLDRELDVTPGADYYLLISGEGRLTPRIKGAAEECENGVVHRDRV